jgi:sec-independent protein translocase protein TatC
MSENKKQQDFMDHLSELRSKLLKSAIFILIAFLALVYFSNSIYEFVAEPLQAFLPKNSTMIATEVASPFLSPLRLTFYVSLLISIPFLLSQVWSFIAPGMYKNERILSLMVLASSIVLFYLGTLFAYFVVFPLVFGFFTSSAPEGVMVMTDIGKYLDFVLTMIFAFSFCFEIPILIYLLIWSEISTVENVAKKRPYVIILCFVIAMFLTPPDVLSQTLLAIPSWFLFELGLLMARLTLKNK